MRKDAGALFTCFMLILQKRFQKQLLEIIQHKGNELFETAGTFYSAAKAEIRTNQMTI